MMNEEDKTEPTIVEPEEAKHYEMVCSAGKYEIKLMPLSQPDNSNLISKE